MKKIIGLSSILAVLLSQTGCVGNNAPAQEEPVGFPYAKQAIKQQLAEQLMGQKEPVAPDYFETVKYTPMMQQMMERGASVFGEKEEQQVFWYYLMQLRLLMMYYTYPYMVTDGKALLAQLDELGSFARAFMERHPAEGKEIFASVIAYEEAHPYNPQKGLDEKRARVRKEKEDAPIELTNNISGEKIYVSMNELRRMTRLEMGKKFGVPQEEIDKFSDEQFEQQKQKMLDGFAKMNDMFEDFEDDMDELGGRFQSAMHQFGNALGSVKEVSKEELRGQLQKDADSLKNIPQTFPAVREQILQVFKTNLEAMKNGHSKEVLVLARLSYAGGADALLRAVNMKNINDPVYDNGETLLIRAVSEGETNFVKDLVKAGADVNKPANEGETPLITAVCVNQADTVRLLLEAGADVNAATQQGWTALLFASKLGYADIVKMLLDAGADVNAETRDGRSAVLSAHMGGHTDIVDMLLAAGTK